MLFTYVNGKKVQEILLQLLPSVSLRPPPPVHDTKQKCNRYEEVVRSTAELVSKWQCVGFTHGVLNTDNMSLLGLTIDYGPYGFMDFFDPQFVPNGSDSGGRYSYEKQPEVCTGHTLQRRLEVCVCCLGV